jgi:hypothetical protein
MLVYENMDMEVIFIEIIRTNFQPIYKKSKNRLSTLFQSISMYYDRNGRIFELYRIRGLILSGFAPLLLVLPMYLIYYSFANLSYLTPVYFILFLLLLLPWAIIPAFFIFYNPNKYKYKKIIAWSWVGIMVAAGITWTVIFIRYQ